MMYVQDGAAKRAHVCDVSLNCGEAGFVTGLARGHVHFSSGLCGERSATDPEARPSLRLASAQVPAGALYVCPKARETVQEGAGGGSIFGVLPPPMIVGIAVFLSSTSMTSDSPRPRRVRW